MGDRGNIVVRASEDNRDDVWFYTHWSGSSIQDVAKAALKQAKDDRWGDTPYLARIVFDNLKGDDRGNTGFGISTCIGDNENAIVVIDDANQRVFLIEEDELSDGRIPNGYKPNNSQTYEEFIGGSKKAR